MKPYGSKKEASAASFFSASSPFVPPSSSANTTSNLTQQQVRKTDTNSSRNFFSNNAPPQQQLQQRPGQSYSISKAKVLPAPASFQQSSFGNTTEKAYSSPSKSAAQLFSSSGPSQIVSSNSSISSNVSGSQNIQQQAPKHIRKMSDSSSVSAKDLFNAPAPFGANNSQTKNNVPSQKQLPSKLLPPKQLPPVQSNQKQPVASAQNFFSIGTSSKEVPTSQSTSDQKSKNSSKLSQRSTSLSSSIKGQDTGQKISKPASNAAELFSIAPKNEKVLQSNSSKQIEKGDKSIKTGKDTVTGISKPLPKPKEIQNNLSLSNYSNSQKEGNDGVQNIIPRSTVTENTTFRAPLPPPIKSSSSGDKKTVFKVPFSTSFDSSSHASKNEKVTKEQPKSLEETQVSSVANTKPSDLLPQIRNIASQRHSNKQFAKPPPLSIPLPSVKERTGKSDKSKASLRLGSRGNSIQTPLTTGSTQEDTNNGSKFKLPPPVNARVGGTRRERRNRKSAPSSLAESDASSIQSGFDVPKNISINTSDSAVSSPATSLKRAEATKKTASEAAASLVKQTLEKAKLKSQMRLGQKKLEQKDKIDEEWIKSDPPKFEAPIIRKNVVQDSVKEEKCFNQNLLPLNSDTKPKPELQTKKTVSSISSTDISTKDIDEKHAVTRQDSVQSDSDYVLVKKVNSDYGMGSSEESEEEHEPAKPDKSDTIKESINKISDEVAFINKESEITDKDDVKTDEVLHDERSEKPKSTNIINNMTPKQELTDEISDSINKSDVDMVQFEPQEKNPEGIEVQMNNEENVENKLEPNVSSLPEGWIEAVDPSSNQIYYYHEADNITSWDRPNEPIANDDVEAEKETATSDINDEFDLVDNEERDIPPSETEVPADDQIDTMDEPEAVSDVSPLPEGWIEAVDPSSNQVYYYHAEDNITSWDRPSAPDGTVDDGEVDDIVDESADVVVEDSLAEDNHETVDEVKDDDKPVVSDEAEEIEIVDTMSEVPPLPEGWVEAVDPSSNQVYYYHAEDNITTWDRPSAPDGTVDDDGKVDEIVDESADVVNDEVGGDVVDEVVAGSSATEEVQQPSAEETEVAPTELPVGWVEAVDPSSNQVYYYHAEDNITTWDRPSAPDGTVDDDGEVDDIVDESADVAIDKVDEDIVEVVASSSVGLQETEKDATTAQTPEESQPLKDVTVTVTVAAVSDVSALPVGWVEAVDPSSNQVYYYHAEDNITTWDRPSAPDGTVDDDGAVDDIVDESADVAIDKVDEDIVDELVACPDATEKVLQPSAEQTEVIAIDEGTTETEVAATELPEGWVEAVDPSSNQVYYYHAEDNITTWDRPSAPDGTVDDGEVDVVIDESADVAIDKVDDDIADEIVACPDSTEKVLQPSAEQTEVIAIDEGTTETEAAATELPEGWVEAVDPSSNQVYYYHAEDNITTWDRPSAPDGTVDDGEVDVVVGESAEDNHETMDGDIVEVVASSSVGLQETEKDATTVQSPEESQPSEGANDGEDNGEDVTVTVAAVSDVSALPVGWVEAVDPSSNQVYYYHAEDNITTWDRPSAPDGTVDGDTTEEVTVGSVLTEEVQQPSAEIETTTDDTEEAEVDTADDDKAAKEDEAPMPLPEGWIEAVDPSSNQVYFYHEGDNITTWERPSVPIVMNDENNVEVMKEECLNDDKLDGEGEIKTEIVSEGKPTPMYDDQLYASDIAKAETEAESSEVFPLPVGWIEAEDPSSNRVYYYHAEDNITTWDRPKLVNDKLEEDEANERIASPVGEAKVEINVTTSEPSEDGKSTKSDTNDETKAESTEVEVSPLPEGWIEAVDPSSNQVYFYHEGDNVTTWDRPSAPVTDIVITDNPFGSGNNGEGLEDKEKEGESSFENSDIDNDLDNSPSTVLEVDDDNNHDDVAMNQVFETTPLPEGWIEAVDPSSNQIYYYHEADNITSWDRPNEPIANDDSEAEKETTTSDINDEFDLVENEERDIPPSETEVLADGQIDTMDEPEAVSDVSPLPEGWVEAVDPSSNQVYYYHAGDNITSWDRPSESVTEDDGEVDDIVDESADVVNDKVGGNVVDELVAGSSATEEVQEPSAAEPEVAATELPVGWVEAVDPSSNQVYYYHAEDNITTWDRPSAPDGTVDGGEVEDIVNESAEDNHETMDGDIVEVVASSTVGLQETEKDATTAQTPEEFQPSEGANDGEDNGEDVAVTVAAVSDVSALPVGWVEAVDPSSNQVYYYHAEDNITTWDRPSAPDGTVDGDTTEEVTVGSVLTEEVQQPSAEIETTTDDTEETEVDTANNDKAAKEDEAPMPLPEGWIEAVDPSSNQVYFYHEGDNITTWERPSVPIVMNDENNVEEVNSSGKNHVDDEVDLDIGKSSNSTSSVCDKESSDVPISGEEITPLPEGWTEVEDPASGKKYFYHEGDNITSWDRPNTLSKNNFVEDSIKEAVEESENFTQDEPNISTFNDQLSNEIYATETDVNLSLPEGWEEMTDPSSNQVYYYHAKDNITTWDRPSKPSVDDNEKTSNSVSITAEKESETTSSDNYIPALNSNEEPESSSQVKNDTSSLPHGWEELLDPSSNKIYYFHAADNITTWERPSSLVTVEKRNTTSNNSVSVKHNISESEKARRIGKPACAIASFGFGGKLCVMMPQTAVPLSGVQVPSDKSVRSLRKGPVVIRPLNEVVEKSCVGLPNKFSPGVCDTPFISSSDADVTNFLEKKSTNEGPQEASELNSSLLWSLIHVAVNAKGRLRSDEGTRNSNGPENTIINLLLGNSESAESTEPNNLSLTMHQNDESLSTSLNEIQGLLMRGNREDAVSKALDSKQFALAVLVSTMCGTKTFQEATRRFANESLPKGSCLRTISILCSGLLLKGNGAMVAAASFWAEIDPVDLKQTWKSHLATILSNQSAGWDRLVVALGDRLFNIGDVLASHFCYLVCGCAVRSPTDPLARIVLLGCDHNVPMHASLFTTEGIESFRRTEALEWARRRGNSSVVIRALQPFKLCYAKLLADYGEIELSRQYVKNIKTCVGMNTKGKTLNVNSSFQKQFMEELKVFEDRVFGGIRHDAEGNELWRNPIKMFLNLVPGNSKSEEVPPENNVIQDEDDLKGEDTLFTPPLEVASEIVTDTAPPEKMIENVSSGSSELNIIEEKQTSKQLSESLPKIPEANEPEVSAKVDEPKPEIRTEAPKAPAPKPNASSKSNPAQGSEKKSWLQMFRERMNPDSNVVDLTEEGEVYYDKKLKRYIFPGDDIKELSKPPPLPPKIPVKKDKQSAPVAPAVNQNDPLAFLMAPPPRTVIRPGTTTNKPSVLTPPLRGLPGTVSNSSNKATPPVPKFTVFQPKPQPKKEKKESE